MTERFEDLVRRLPERSDDDFAAVRLIGRAVSRSDTHLHLATRTGVVAVPLSDINDVRVRFPDDPTRVAVTVRDRDNVRLVRRAVQVRSRPDIDPGPVVIVGPGVRTTVCSTTYTDEGEEMVCDDENCEGHDDDEPE
jgi:hypothetical protein